MQFSTYNPTINIRFGSRSINCPVHLNPTSKCRCNHVFRSVFVAFCCSPEKFDTFTEELVWDEEADELSVVCWVELDPLADGSDEDLVDARKLECDWHPKIGTLFWRFRDKARAMPIVYKN
jgi:hypothetical protein